jgi:hypothetical protein
MWVQNKVWWTFRIGFGSERDQLFAGVVAVAMWRWMPLCAKGLDLVHPRAGHGIGRGHGG